MDEPRSLTDRLTAAAAAWVSANDSTLSKLGRAVINDTSFFDGLPARRHGPSTGTLEKFASFLADPANWPEGAVAEEARALAHVVGVSLPDGALSAGLSGDASTGREQAA